MNGYIAQGFNPLAAAPNKAKMTAALAKLKFLVIMDPLGHRDVASSGATTASTTTSTRRKIQTEVFRLPTTCFAEENGTLDELGALAAVALEGRRCRPARRAAICEIMAGIFTRMRTLYATDGGAFPDPILNLTWPYAQVREPLSGRAGARSTRARR